MVYVAEWLRRKFVALVYAGSIPVVHPGRKTKNSKECQAGWVILR